MAGENRNQARALVVLGALRSEPHRFDLFQAMRRLECAFRDRPRLGDALRAADEPVRFGQEPSLAFALGSIEAFSDAGAKPRLSTPAFGVFGPNGPLPLHLTEYARDRVRNHGDATFARFVDVFHHRMLTLFYRAFADAEPAIGRDRPESDRFATFVGALFGMGLPSTRDRDTIRDLTKLHYAGLLARQTRDAAGLETFLRGLFRVPARVDQFVGEWVEIPAANRSKLGLANSTLGIDAILGTHTWLCSGKFRVALGPLRREQFESFLPGSEKLERLASAVRVYAGDELTWELELALAASEGRPLALGRSRLGWGTWIGMRPSTWQSVSVTFDPARRTAFTPRRGRDREEVLDSPDDTLEREPLHV